MISTYMKKYLVDQAESCKRHLEKHKAAICEVYTEDQELEMNREIFLEVLGADLIKRVKFLPIRY